MRQRTTEELSVLKPSGSGYLWPAVIVLSSIAVALVNMVFTDIAVRPIVVCWFIGFCPGMVLVRFMRLREPLMEWTLALALSLAVAALVAGVQLYTGTWSPTATLCILIGLSLGGTGIQIAMEKGHAMAK